MPRVPQLEGPQVDFRPLPNVRLDADNYTGGARQAAALGDAVAGLGDAAFKAGIQMQEREDADKLFSTEAALSESQRTFETDALASEGQNAWGLQDKGRKFWDEQAQQLGKDLTNDRQRKLFAQSLVRAREGSLDRLARHESGQRRASLEKSTDASVVGLIDNAVANPTDMAAVGAARDGIQRKGQVMADLNGWDEAQLGAWRAEKLSILHGTVVERLADANPEVAKKYLEATKGEIRGTRLAAIEKTLQQSTLSTVAQGAADEVFAQGLGESAALKWAREKYSGAEEREVVQEIAGRFSEQRRVLTEREKTAGDQVQRMLNEGTPWSQVPASLRAQMDPKAAAGLRAGDNVKTDWNRYAELRQMATGDPAAFKALDLRAEFSALAPAQRESLLDLQAKKPDGLGEVRSVDSQIRASLAAIDLKSDARTIAADRIEAEIDVEQTQRGRKLTQDERQKIIDRMLVNGEVDGSGYVWDDTKRVYELKPGDRPAFEAEIPDDEREVIVRWYKERKGYAPSEYEIQKTYKKEIGLD